MANKFNTLKEKPQQNANRLREQQRINATHSMRASNSNSTADVLRDEFNKRRRNGGGTTRYNQQR